MLEIGKINKLKVIKKVEFGVYLDGGDFGEILLPNKTVLKNCEVNDLLDVFIYFDSEDRIIATTRTPYAKVEEFAYLEAVDSNKFGAFLDWGLTKDLFVPFKEQSRKMETGKSYFVWVYYDEESRRIAASSKINKYLDTTPATYEPNEEVSLMIHLKTDLGYRAIINKAHWGVIYKNEVFKTLYPGQQIKGYIKEVREDGKIDLVLQLPGYQKIDPLAEEILTMLKKRNGSLSVTDKSDPEVIYELFGVSKKSFKKAVGTLYKKKLIVIEKNFITLVK